MNNIFSGRHILITGGSKGIGLATGTLFARKGANISLLARSKEPLEEAEQEIRTAVENVSVLTLSADVTDPDALSDAFQKARDQNGPLYTLVNNAGRVETNAFEDTSLEQWNRILSINLTGMFNCIREAIPNMKDRETGRIINNASTSALKGYPYVSAYTAAKHGVLGLTRSLAREWAGSGITINAVCPGYTDTDLIDESVRDVAASTGADPKAIRNQFQNTNPLGRFIEPEEVASAIVFLAHPDQSGINGEHIVIDGGETA